MTGKHPGHPLNTQSQASNRTGFNYREEQAPDQTERQRKTHSPLYKHKKARLPEGGRAPWRSDRGDGFPSGSSPSPGTSTRWAPTGPVAPLDLQGHPTSPGTARPRIGRTPGTCCGGPVRPPQDLTLLRLGRHEAPEDVREGVLAAAAGPTTNVTNSPPGTVKRSRSGTSIRRLSITHALSSPKTSTAGTLIVWRSAPCRPGAGGGARFSVDSVHAAD